MIFFLDDLVFLYILPLQNLVLSMFAIFTVLSIIGKLTFNSDAAILLFYCIALSREPYNARIKVEIEMPTKSCHC